MNFTCTMLSEISQTEKDQYCVMLLMCVCLVAQSCWTLCDPVDCSPPGSSAHGDSPGKNTGVGCHALLQGIFLTQDWTWVSHIAGRCFTFWAIREVLGWQQMLKIRFYGLNMWWTWSLRDIKEFCVFPPLFCLFVLQFYWREEHIAMLTTVI